MSRDAVILASGLTVLFGAFAYLVYRVSRRESQPVGDDEPPSPEARAGAPVMVSKSDDRLSPVIEGTLAAAVRHLGSKEKVQQWATFPRGLCDPVVSELERHPRIRELFDRRMQVLGGQSGSTDLHTLAQWLVRRTAHVESSRAVSDLYNYVDADTWRCSQIMLLNGVVIDGSGRVDAEIEIGPFEALPNGPMKEEFRRDGGVVLSRRLTLPKLHQDVGAEPPDWMRQSARSPLLEWVRHCLTVIGRCAPVVRAEWVEPDPATPIGTSRTGWQAPADRSFRETTSVDSGQIDRIGELFSAFRVVPTDQQMRLAVAIQRVNRSIRALSVMDQAIELGIALEALFVPESRGIPSARLYLRAARFLGSDLSERRRHHGAIKALYGLRSAAVHSGRLSQKQLRAARDVLPTGRGFLFDALEKVIEAPVGDWTEVELG